MPEFIYNGIKFYTNDKTLKATFKNYNPGYKKTLDGKDKPEQKVPTLRKIRL